jgi:hypothetical protein
MRRLALFGLEDACLEGLRPIVFGVRAAELGVS